MSEPLKKTDDQSFLHKLGPGLITGAADDDPSGIANYSQAGAQFGPNMLWTALITFPLMVGIQIVSGRVTGAEVMGRFVIRRPPEIPRLAGRGGHVPGRADDVGNGLVIRIAG